MLVVVARARSSWCLDLVVGWVVVVVVVWEASVGRERLGLGLAVT